MIGLAAAVFSGLGLVMAVIAGIIVAAIAGFLLNYFFCDGEGPEPQEAHVVVEPEVVAEPEPDPTDSVETGTAPEVSEAAETDPTEVEVTAEPMQGSDDGEDEGTTADEATGEGVRPPALDEPREGDADDLKIIEGIGPKLEATLNMNGIYHYDQIAAWTDEEVVWMDNNLPRFKGRVTRDNWVEQAKLVLKLGVAGFRARAKTNDVEGQ